MELQKRKYKRHQVIAMIDAYKAQYEKLISELNARNSILAKENEKLVVELENLKSKKDINDNLLINSNGTSEEIRYSLEIERLAEINKKMEEYFIKLKAKYPMCSPNLQSIDIKNQAEQLLKTNNVKKAINKLNKEVKDDEIEFNPKQKINDYIVATSDNGFNLNDVLNPGELELEELCKELGLIEQSE